MCKLFWSHTFTCISLLRLSINLTTLNETTESFKLDLFFPSKLFKLWTKENIYCLFFFGNVAPEMQLWLLSHVHQMEDACSSFRSWPIFLCFTTLWFISTYIFGLVLMKGFCSETQHLCSNNETISVKVTNMQMGFIIKNVGEFTSSCDCLRSCHVFKCFPSEKQTLFWYMGKWHNYLFAF